MQDQSIDSNGMKGQRGYILLVAPIILVGISFLAFQSINRSRVSMQIAGAEFKNLQTKLCTQQCAAVAVNQITRTMNSNEKLSDGGEACACPGKDQVDPITCENTWSTPVETRLSNCYGLEVARTNMDIQVQCQEGSNRALKINENVSFQEIPIFQFAVFFDKVLELHNGPPMELTGRVHSNDTIKIWPPGSLKLHDWLTSPAVIMGRRSGKVSMPKMDGTGPDDGVAFTNPELLPLEDLYPDWPEWKKNHRVAYGNQGGSCGSVEKLAVPLKGMGNPHILIDWREPDDTYELKRQKYAWRANLIYKDGQWLDNNLHSINIQSPKKWWSRRPAMGGKTDPTRITFWDNRENLMVEVISIDMAILQQRPKDSIVYLYDENIDPDQSDRDIGGFLITNGDRLLRPLTVVTNSRVYMWGDYNTDSSYIPASGGRSPFPAAIICDAYTQLSNQWNPVDYTRGNKWSKKIQSWNSNEVTVLNACIMSGMPAVNGSWSGQGGYHNFIRFMEDWSNVPFEYSGSTVAIWDFKISQGGMSRTWYTPPIRKWAFDPMYRDLKNMPPGTPRVVSPSLNSWELARD
jgi:hypothetical protein